MTASTTLPLPNEFNDDTDFWNHPTCNTYESNRLGVVRNIKSKNEVGFKNNVGYYILGCRCCTRKRKTKIHLKHRFIFECFNGLIEDGKVIDHIDGNPSNNNLDNLQMITQSENLKKITKEEI